MTDKKRPGPWTDEENAACVALYFTMLDEATQGVPYVKAAMIREAQGQAPYSSPTTGIENVLHSAVSKHAALADRSRASIEMKLMNCTAAHAQLLPDAQTMDNHGYRAMPNMQAALKAAVTEQLKRRHTIRRSA